MAMDRTGRWIIAAVLVAAAFAMAFRVGLLGAPGEFDEFYHLLAARGLVETGHPAILEGEYRRGLLFTRMIAGLFELTGRNGLGTARLISVLAGAAIPALLVLWVARAAGPWPAALAGLFAVLWPQAIIEAQLARFYAFHVLFFLAGAIAMYAATVSILAGKRARGLAFALLGVLCWGVALRLQVVTIIGIAAVLSGAAALSVPRVATTRSRALALAVLVIAAAAGALAVAILTDLGAKAVAFYRWTPEHAAALRNYQGFYFDQMERGWGLLWYVTPLLALAAFRVRPGLTVYCGLAFAVCFVVHSFGGMKALRYLSYAMPFLFVIWGLGLSAMAAGVARRFGGRGRAATLAVAMIVILLATPFGSRSLELAAGRGLPARGDWRGAAEVVRDWADAPFVVTTRELHHLAHLGAYDLLFSPSRVSELSPPRDFGRDTRTGRPVIGTAAAWSAVLGCEPDGLLVTSPHFWRTRGWAERLVPPLAARGYAVEIREAGAVLALRWRSTAPRGAECDDLVAPPS
ncbi:hypothetical protein MWU52_13105 [Jannaschia sp. S6380]|uniref:hypothetical protein n=1 Tax=Jannaschia sp. S6380 TaxID=2926408 RepID=UPI001FF44CFC|nr:hypothetical protein [Jannaschia sp. S6380]MCK0168497.1 hypothetical protein [Jannaschia sp. S6380]